MRAPQRRPIRVLLADDHPLVRVGIQAMLARSENIRVVAEAASGEEAVSLAEKTKPDIALLDINMPGISGLAAARRLRKKVPSCRVIIVSMHEDSAYVRQAVAAGAKGYVQKDSAPEHLRRAIEAVHHGRTFFSDTASRALLAEMVGGGGDAEDAGGGGLTERELEVLVLVANGASNKEIAAALKIGVRTVETHRERVMRKLGVRTAAGLTKYAIAHGLIELK